MKITFFTICAKNYISYARTLFYSLQEVYGNNFSFYLVLSDRADGYLDISEEPMKIVECDKLGIAELDDMSLRYNITEFSTAIKPAAFEYLFNENESDAVIYLDPDIYVVNKLNKVEELLANGSDAVLTPHTCKPIEDGKKPDDQSMLQAGTYNLGFLALSNSKTSRDFLSWWHRRLVKDCRIDLPEGLFVDQKWADMLPCFIEKTTVLHDPGYNVAYWNLMSRKVTRKGSDWYSNDGTLSFVHFSGVESPDPSVFSKHQTRFNANNIGDLGILLSEYRQAVMDNGREITSGWPYAFSKASNGVSIPVQARRIYREQVDGKHAIDGDVSQYALSYCNSLSSAVLQDEGLIITTLMKNIWDTREDLQIAFDLSSIHGREGFVGWFLTSWKEELSLDPYFVDGVKKGYELLQNSQTEDVDNEQSTVTQIERVTLPMRLSRFKAGIARTVLASVHKARPLYIYMPVAMRIKLKGILIRNTVEHGRAGIIRITTDTGFKSDTPEEIMNETVVSNKIETDLLDGALLIGYPKAELGMGEHVRLTARSFNTESIPFGIYNFDKDIAARQDDNRYDALITTSANYKANIFHINADQMEVAKSILGAEMFDGKYNIGYWAWELSIFPDAWMSALDMVDEIWAPSRFIQQAISEKAKCPVVWMPLAVELDDPDTRFDRSYFNLPSNDYLFVFYFDFASFGSRKNPYAVIEAFRKAFPKMNDKAGLVIKVMGQKWHKEEIGMLQNEIEHDPRMVILDKVLSHQEMAGLINTCNAFVSLHRSEGFGRGLAEAMYFGKPVIATNYSGNTDFMRPDTAYLVNYTLCDLAEKDYPHAAGQVWANPDVDQAAEYMKYLVDNPGAGDDIGKVAQSYIRYNHSSKVIGQRYSSRLKLLGIT